MKLWPTCKEILDVKLFKDTGVGNFDNFSLPNAREAFFSENNGRI